MKAPENRDSNFRRSPNNSSPLRSKGSSDSVLDRCGRSPHLARSLQNVTENHDATTAMPKKPKALGRCAALAACRSGHSRCKCSPRHTVFAVCLRRDDERWGAASPAFRGVLQRLQSTAKDATEIWPQPPKTRRPCEGRGPAPFVFRVNPHNLTRYTFINNLYLQTQDRVTGPCPRWGCEILNYRAERLNSRFADPPIFGLDNSGLPFPHDPNPCRR